ncbi:hypothetical protein IJ596_00605 [bacterium]|nr:hypothetical protein [bacterium]
MVCDGRIGGSGFNPKTYTPNLNRNQKGVPGLQQALSKTGGKPSVFVHENPVRRTFRYDNTSQGSAPAIMVHVDKKSGRVDYQYVDRTDPSNAHTVRAYDNDRDGNIDSYTVFGTYDAKTGKKEPDKTFVNTKDDGQNHFVEQKSSKAESHWYDPRTWF